MTNQLNLLDSEIVTCELALLGGSPVRTQPYPKWPVVDQRDIQAVTAVLESGNWGGSPYPGEQTAEFAQRFAKMQGGGEAVPMANGTVTMEVALRAVEIGWGDQVIVPSYTFQATAAATIMAGAIPVLVDIDPQTYCIAPEAIEAAITAKTRAIIPVHLGAQMADMDAIMDIARRHNLIVIEDCAHAHGARWDEQGAGTIGHFGSFSLQSSKSITTGEGGVLLCRTEKLAEQVAKIINWGQLPVTHSETITPGQLKPDQLFDIASKFYQAQPSQTLGSNYRMTQMQAALGNVALERFPQQRIEREGAIATLESGLQQIPGVRLLKDDPRQTRRSLYRYIFAIEPEVFGAENQEVCLALLAEGIPCWSGYQPIHRNHLFQPWATRLPVPTAFADYFNYEQLNLPHTERASQSEAVWLDESVFRAGNEGIEDVVAAIAKVQTHAATLGAVKQQFLQALNKKA